MRLFDLLGSSARSLIITEIDSSSCFLTVIINIAYEKRLKDRENVNYQSVYNIAYYEWYLSAPIEKHCNSYGTVLLTSVEMNHRMLKIINFSDGYKVTTNAFSMLLTVC